MNLPSQKRCEIFTDGQHSCSIALFKASGLSHPFLGMGPGPLELGKIASFKLKLGKIQSFMHGSFYCQTDLTYMVLLYFQRTELIGRQNKL